MPSCRLLGDPGEIEARGTFSGSSHVQSSKGPKMRQHGRLQEKRSNNDRKKKAIANETEKVGGGRSEETGGGTNS